MFQHFFSLVYVWQIRPVFLFDQMAPPVQSDFKLDSFARKLFNSYTVKLFPKISWPILNYSTTWKQITRSCPVHIMPRLDW